MGRVLQIVFYAIVLALLFLWLSTVYKSCQAKKTDTTTIELDSGDEFDEGYSDETADLTDLTDEFEETEEKSYQDLDEALDDVDDLTEPYQGEIEEEVKSTPTPVSKPASPVKKEEVYKPRPSSSVGDYLIVAGNYSIADNAESMKSKLKRMGYSKSEIVQFDKSSFSTVVASRFQDYDLALQEAAKLKTRGIDCYVHKKKD